MRSTLFAFATCALLAAPTFADSDSQSLALEAPNTEVPQVSDQDADTILVIKIFAAGYCEGYYKEKEPNIATGATQDQHDKWVHDKRTCFAAEVVFLRDQFNKAGVLKKPNSQ